MHDLGVVVNGSDALFWQNRITECKHELAQLAFAKQSGQQGITRAWETQLTSASGDQLQYDWRLLLTSPARMRIADKLYEISEVKNLQ